MDTNFEYIIKQFDAIESNLQKLETTWTGMRKEMPDSPAFGQPEKYTEMREQFDQLYEALPKINEWKPEISIPDYDDFGQALLDAEEVGEFSAKLAVFKWMDEPGEIIKKYKIFIRRERRKIVRTHLVGVIKEIDGNIAVVESKLRTPTERSASYDGKELESIKELAGKAATLLGPAFGKPPRWSDLWRHLNFGLYGDMGDIVEHDWPSVRKHLKDNLYDDTEPEPVDLKDIGQISKSRILGPIPTKLRWDNLSDEDFERLIFTIIGVYNNYENPEWLTKTNAPDRGRDLSVNRVYNDPLTGTVRKRVIIQCKHYLSKSISVDDVAKLKQQMELWTPPRIDYLIIATSGRFTTDAIQLIEKNNKENNPLIIEMWPESQMEVILSRLPHIISQFNLR